MNRFSVILAILLAVVAPGCGGGGGGDASAGNAFQGSFHSVSFRGTEDDWRYSITEWGTYSADGSASVSGLVMRNLPPVGIGDPRVVGPIPMGPDAYTLGTGGALTISGADTWMGALSEDETVCLLSGMAPGDDPGLLLLLRRSGTFSNASLNGTYHFIGLSHASLTHSVVAGTTAFDGAGGASTTFRTNSDGTLGGPFGPTSTPYDVGADGTVAFTSGTSHYEGGMLASGDVVVLAGRTMPGASESERGLIILIRRSIAADLESFSGRYQAVRLALPRTDSRPAWTALLAPRVSDGMGMHSGSEGLVNLDGAVDEFRATGPIAYTVAPDGTVETLDYQGAVSPDGRLVVIANFATIGSPALWVMLK